MKTTNSTVRTCRRGHMYRKSSDCPICPKCAAEEKKRNAGEFPVKLAAPGLRALRSAGINTLAQLSKRSEAQIAALHGMGPKAIGELRKALRAHGLSFASGAAKRR